MTKPLRNSMNTGKNYEAIQRRLKALTGGLGFWAAVDAVKMPIWEAKKLLNDKKHNKF